MHKEYSRGDHSMHISPKFLTTHLLNIRKSLGVEFLGYSLGNRVLQNKIQQFSVASNIFHDDLNQNSNLLHFPPRALYVAMLYFSVSVICTLGSPCTYLLWLSLIRAPLMFILLRHLILFTSKLFLVF